MSKYINLNLVKTYDIILNEKFILKKGFIINTLHYLYNKNSNKYLIYDYKNKKFIENNGKIEESSLILYFNDKINIINLNAEIAIISLNINEVKL